MQNLTPTELEALADRMSQLQFHEDDPAELYAMCYSLDKAMNFLYTNVLEPHYELTPGRALVAKRRGTFKFYGYSAQPGAALLAATLRAMAGL